MLEFQTFLSEFFRNFRIFWSTALGIPDIFVKLVLEFHLFLLEKNYPGGRILPGIAHFCYNPLGNNCKNRHKMAIASLQCSVRESSIEMDLCSELEARSL